MTIELVCPDKGLRIGKRYQLSSLLGEFLEVTIGLREHYLYVFLANHTYVVSWSDVM